MPYSIKINYTSQEMSSLVTMDSAQNASSEEWQVSLHNNLSRVSNSTNYVPYERRPETYIVPCIFSIIFLLGLAGNGTLVYAFFQQRSLRTLPNTLIISLSVGDLLTLCGALPFVSTIYTVDSWPYGELVCKLSELLRDLSSGVSVYTLALLSLDRYMAIVRPLHRYTGPLGRRRRRTIASVTGIWAVSAVFASPGLINSHLLRITVAPGRHILVCYPFPPALGPAYARFIVMLKFLALYLVPLTLIGCFYAAMARHLLASAAHLQATHQASVEHAARQVRSRVKVAKIVLAFIVIFAMCFFPSHVFLLWFYFWPDAYNNYNNFWHLLRIVGFVLTFTSSCLNPIALYFISGVFRKHFKRYMCGLACFFACLRVFSGRKKMDTNTIGTKRIKRTKRMRSRKLYHENGNRTLEGEDEGSLEEEEDEEADENTSGEMSSQRSLRAYRRCTNNSRTGRLMSDCCCCCAESPIVQREERRCETINTSASRYSLRTALKPGSSESNRTVGGINNSASIHSNFSLSLGGKNGIQERFSNLNVQGLNKKSPQSPIELRPLAAHHLSRDTETINISIIGTNMEANKLHKNQSLLEDMEENNNLLTNEDQISSTKLSDHTCENKA